MAINPNTVNILNVDELNQVSSIENDDLIVIGQGIYARKSTVYQLYQKFGLENIEDAIFELQQQQGDVDLTTVLRFIPQPLQESDKQTARSNISALDVRMAELSNDLTAGEKSIIQEKLGIEDTDLTGLLANPTYDSDTHIFTMDVIGGSQFQIDFPIEALITNVDLDDDNNLVITFEDGSEVLVPLNTLLVGVVKTVNGKNPNSQGIVTINISDIPNLQSELDNKANVSDIPDVSNFVPYTGATQDVDLNAKSIDNATRYQADRGADLTWANAVNSDPEAWNQDSMSLIKLSANNNSLAIIADGTQNARKFGIQVGHSSPLFASSDGTLWLQPLHGNVGIGSLSGTGVRMVVVDSSGILSRQVIPTVNDGKLTLSTGDGLSGSATFTANQDSNSVFSVSLSQDTLTSLHLADTALQDNDLNGYISDVQYNSSTKTITFYRHQEPNIVVDLSAEQLISNVELDDDNNLVITFEDNSVVTIPLNTLLVGVVKSVNGKNPNSQGEVVISADDISDLPTKYLPLAGGTMTGNIDFGANGSGLYFGGNFRIRLSSASTIIAGASSGIQFRPTSYPQSSDAIIFEPGGQINTPNHGNSSQWKQAFDATQNLPTNYVTTNGVQNITATKTFTVAPIVPNGTLNGHTVNLGQLNDKLGEKADIDGSNTTGGTWIIDRLGNNEVGLYVDSNEFNNAKIGIPSTDALGSTYGVRLMRGGSPLAIAENNSIDWDGYIYRVGVPLSGYPANQQNGNYLIESKHRFRFHPISSPDSTSGTAGFLKIQPFNGIEHSYYRVTFTGLEIANIDMDPPNTDELTGFSIERNAIGQKCTVAVSGSMKEVKFTNVSGVDFSSAWNKGVFEFYWTGNEWIFGGYSPIEP